MARVMANRSISISLEEGLLAALDAEGANRSAMVSEAINLWLRQKRLNELNQAYAALAELEGGDLNQAAEDATAMSLACRG